MSGESEEEYEESSEEPFESNSEDDWKPNQESSDESDGEFQTGSSPSPEKKRSRGNPVQSKSNAKKSNGTTAKKKPETATRTGKVMSGSIRELLDRAKASQKKKLNISGETPTSSEVDSPATTTKKSPPQKKVNSPKKLQKKAEKTTESDDDASSSYSSGDDHLVDPATLDLGSTFFKINSPAKENRVPTPNFDCNIGVGQLTDSEDEDYEGVSDNENEKSSTTDSAGQSTNIMENLNQFARKIDEAKETLKKFEANKGTQPTPHPTTKTDVGSLLALGESSGKDLVEPEGKVSKANNKKTTATKKKRRQSHEDSEDSDWEEVEDVPIPDTTTERVPGDLQIFLDMPDRRQAKFQNDLETALKRQMNKEKREQQVQLHQGGFREWLDQGNYINGILNNTQLFGVSLKLLPGSKSYPKDKTDVKYFEQITKWYVTAINVPPATQMYPPLAHDLDMKGSLQKQIESKTVNSKRDFILIFIILLRAMGMQCRMVINLVVPPIRPPSSELCRITAKPKEEKASTSAKKKNKSTNKSKTENASSDDEEDYDEIAKQLSTSKETKKSSAKKAPPKSKESSRSKSKDSEAITSTPSKEKSSNSKESPKKERSRSSRSKATTSSLKVETTVSPRRTRSRTPSKQLLVPQLDGMDDTQSTPVGKRTRSRSKTPVNPLIVKKKILSTTNEDSPIKKKSSANSKNSKSNTLQVPKVKERTVSSDSLELFAIDPTEKKTKPPIKSRPSTSKRSVQVKSEDEPKPKLSRSVDSSTIDRRVLSTDEEDKSGQKNPSKVDFWVEVWSEVEEKWLSVNLFKGKVDSCDTIVRGATVPIAYVLAWNNDSTIKDVSLRYCPQWHSVNKKCRTDQSFVDNALKPFKGKDSAREKKEDALLQKIILERPIPTSISEFKNHPLYALNRHLLKFEAIYPPNPLTLGFVRGEPVYARECVHTLHSRELWVKQARVVKPGETPYKIVTARPKWERATNTVIKDIPLELFGLWQTSEYEPPVAENGIVPKNAYGNVELFKECMLPINTVHLPYNGLNKVCKRLQIDYAPAVVGFDFHSGYSHPVYEGYVVCKEFAEIVTDAWIKDTEEAAKREEEKFLERVYGNWKKLIRGLLIKKRLQLKYKFEDADAVSAQD